MLQIVTSKQRTNSRGLSPRLAKSAVGRPLPVASLKPSLSRRGHCSSVIPDKFLLANETLGGIETANLQMSVASLPHTKRMYATELLGTKVAPVVRNHLVSDSGNDATKFKLEAAVIEDSNRSR